MAAQHLMADVEGVDPRVSKTLEAQSFILRCVDAIHRERQVWFLAHMSHFFAHLIFIIFPAKVPPQRLLHAVRCWFLRVRMFTD